MTTMDRETYKGVTGYIYRVVDMRTGETRILVRFYRKVQ